MPAKSEAQRRFIYGVKGKKFAEAHHFDNKGPLPEKVGAQKKGKAAVKKKAHGKKHKAKKAGKGHKGGSKALHLGNHERHGKGK